MKRLTGLIGGGKINDLTDSPNRKKPDDIAGHPQKRPYQKPFAIRQKKSPYVTNELKRRISRSHEIRLFSRSQKTPNGINKSQNDESRPGKNNNPNQSLHRPTGELNELIESLFKNNERLPIFGWADQRSLFMHRKSDG